MEKEQSFFSQHRLQISVLLVFLGVLVLFIVGSPQTFLSPNIYYAFMSNIPFLSLIHL